MDQIKQVENGRRESLRVYCAYVEMSPTKMTPNVLKFENTHMHEDVGGRLRSIVKFVAIKKERRNVKIWFCFPSIFCFSQFGG